MSAGISVWTTILSIIALYFGGRAAGHLSYAATKLNGMYHGLVTFGLSIFATVLILAMALGTISLEATNPANVSRSWALDIAGKGSWYIFVVLILGGIAAAIGGAHSARRRVVPSVVERTPTSMRPAA